MDGVKSRRKSKGWISFVVLGVIVFAIFLWFQMPLQGPSHLEKELREPMVIMQEKPINYETKIDIEKAKNNPPDIIGFAVSEDTSPGIEFRTIHAVCATDNPDCYVISMPFNYKYVEGQDKIRLVLIRVENDNLNSPDLIYYEKNGNETKQEKRLKDLRFDKVDYSYFGTKGNVFLDLTLDMNKTYCFQLVEGDLKSDIWCQNFEVDAFSDDFIRFSLVPVENPSQIADDDKAELHLKGVFSVLGEEPLKRMLRDSSLKVIYPEEFDKDNLEFSSEDLLENFKYSNNQYLIDIPISLEGRYVKKLMPKEVNGTFIVGGDPVIKVELKQGDASFEQDAILDFSSFRTETGGCSS